MVFFLPIVSDGTHAWKWSISSTGESRSRTLLPVTVFAAGPHAWKLGSGIFIYHHNKFPLLEQCPYCHVKKDKVMQVEFSRSNRYPLLFYRRKCLYIDLTVKEFISRTDPNCSCDEQMLFLCPLLYKFLSFSLCFGRKH